jgi:hypothetical protein
MPFFTFAGFKQVTSGKQCNHIGEAELGLSRYRGPSYGPFHASMVQRLVHVSMPFFLFETSIPFWIVYSTFKAV